MPGVDVCLNEFFGMLFGERVRIEDQERKKIELGVHQKVEIELRGATCPSSGKTHYRGEHEWKNVFR